MVSVIHQHELAIGLHMSPHSPSHPSRLSQSFSFGFSVSYSKFPLAICFTYGLTYVLGQQLLVSGLWPKAACLQWLLQQRDMQALLIAFHALLGALRSLLGPLPKAGLGMGGGHPGTTLVESQSPLSWWQRVRGSNSQDWLFFSTIQKIQAAGEHRPFWRFLWNNFCLEVPTIVLQVVTVSPAVWWVQGTWPTWILAIQNKRPIRCRGRWSWFLPSSIQDKILRTKPRVLIFPYH